MPVFKVERDLGDVKKLKEAKVKLGKGSEDMFEPPKKKKKENN